MMQQALARDVAPDGTLSASKGDQTVRLYERWQRDHETGEFKARVTHEGWVRWQLCSGTLGNRRICGKGLDLSQKEKPRRAKNAVDSFDPGCRVGRIDLVEVTSFKPN